jgi:IclR family acetate operon transcriptional repressor
MPSVSPSTRPPDSVLGRVMALLSAFDADTPVLSLAELSRRCGLPKPTVHRMVAELCEQRLLRRDEAGRYLLGLRLFELGELVPQQRTLREAALPLMEDLREATRCRIHLSVLDGIDVVYVEILGTADAGVPSRPGGRLPAHTTGVGKAILAYSTPEVIRARIDAGLTPLTARTISTEDAFLAELRKIRTVGMALDLEENTPGIFCVAAPVFGADRRIRASLSVTGRSEQLDPAAVGPAVRTAAFTLTRALRAHGL